MALVKVVSGFIDIPGHPRGPADYKALGEQLVTAIEPHEGLIFDSDQQTVGTTWLAQYLKSVPNVAHSIGDNPEKNTMAYHCVQHEKFAWLSAAAKADMADIYVWIDYGILHVPGVTAAVIQKFLTRIEDYGQAVVMPGCWPKADVKHQNPCWRFCGGLIAVPRALVQLFTRAAMGIAVRQIMTTRNVEWEVNTLARLEQHDQVPIMWYQSDHNETMFEALP